MNNLKYYPKRELYQILYEYFMIEGIPILHPVKDMLFKTMEEIHNDLINKQVLYRNEYYVIISTVHDPSQGIYLKLNNEYGNEITVSKFDEIYLIE